MNISTIMIIAAVAIVVFIAIRIISWALSLRRVVPANEVHIVQNSKESVSYGSQSRENGNKYYEFPTWIPFIGITKIVLPLSVFDLDLIDYEAYDKGKLPFRIDVKAFFRISSSNVAAQRVASFEELKSQLQAIVQGSVRTILASNDIEKIMEGRASFGNQFTEEVASQLQNWGVEAVKNIELMDIRDSGESKVIANIMEKKKSLIEMESRIEVAANRQKAETAEIEAQRDVSLRQQEAEQQVGIKTAEKAQAIGIANEQSNQAIKEQQKVTTEKDVAVQKVSEVGKAEIEKNVQIVKAEQKKETDVINANAEKQTKSIKAEGEKVSLTLVGEGQLAAKKFEAEGIAAEGEAQASAAKALALAPVEAQIVLADKVGSNAPYQEFLLKTKSIEVSQVVGVAQATALEKAEIKIIANTGGDASTALTGIGSVISPKGGTNLGGMLEALANTDQGAALLEALLSKLGGKAGKDAAAANTTKTDTAK